MNAELIDFMGSDLTVVNAARVSMDKESEWEWGNDEIEMWAPTLSERDQKLVKYLARENHFTPFTHAVITLRETVPIFVARQRFKHVVGFTYNEISRRYVDDAPEFYVPDVWRSRPDGSVKQGSGEGVVTHLGDSDVYLDDKYRSIEYQYNLWIKSAKGLYEQMIDAGASPEQARMILPQSMYTSYYVTGSLSAFARAYQLRKDPHAQKEIRDLADKWDEIIRPLYPHSWAALVD
jgi:thymidylate synthase (FAD)